MDTGLIRPYSVIQWRCQWSAFRGWPSHSMCSHPHFTGKPEMPRADFAEKVYCLLRAGSKTSAVSRFREKLSPANGVQGITAISRNIALSGVMSAKITKWLAKNGVQHATAIYRLYRFRDIHDRDISGLHCTALKSVKFDPVWAFPDSKSSLNSPMATKWCTKLEVA